MADEKKAQSLTGKYNNLFASIKIGDFPKLDKVIEIKSTDTIGEASEILSKHNILAAPVRDAKQPDSADWSEKYLGCVSMLDLLCFALDAFTKSADEFFKKDQASKGSFLPLLKSATKFNSVPVSAILDDARTPFVPISSESSLLDAMFLLNKSYHLSRLIVVHPKDPTVTNIITQTAVVQLLADKLDQLGDIAKKTLEELGLAKDQKVHSVHITDTPLKAFAEIRQHNVSAVPVIGTEGLMVGNISAKDARIVIQENKPGAFTSVVEPLSGFLKLVQKEQTSTSSTLEVVPSTIIAHKTDTLGDVIRKLIRSKIHRVWIVDKGLKVTGVVSLTDIIHVFVGEPTEGYLKESIAKAVTVDTTTITGSTSNS